MRNLIISGGIRHDFEDNTAALAEQLAQAGFISEIETNIEKGLKRLASDPFDLVTIMTLRWPMDGDPKYAPYREKFGFSLSAQGQKYLCGFVDGGGGLFGIHTACISFSDWPGWRDVLGGSWVWGQSSHPPLGQLSIAPTGPSHPLTEGIEEFELEDEVFSDLSILDSVQCLLTAEAATSPRPQPVLWTHQYGRGRIVFDALGHNRNSIEHGTHSLLIKRCAAWATGNLDAALPV